MDPAGHRPPAAEGAVRTLGIGEVVAALEPAFPGVSASKVRFLEDRGLVTPERTPAGYRRYRAADVDRIRLVLTLQRDRFLPLRVIREHLEALDRGERPAVLEAAPSSVEAERLGRRMTDPARRWTRAELAQESGASEELIGELDQYALLRSRTVSELLGRLVEDTRAAEFLFTAGWGFDKQGDGDLPE